MAEIWETILTSIVWFWPVTISGSSTELGFKEELREEGYSKGDIAEAIGEIIETEKGPPDLERIEEEHPAKRKNPLIVIWVF